MNTTYARLTGRRAWYVPDISVWGDLSAQTVSAVATEADGPDVRVVFYRFPIRGQPQELPYASLTDHRGNQLPASIARPVVIVIPRNSVAVVLVGRPTDVACRLARSAPGAEDGLVDLWIVEAGY
jgi:hypothetical protein